MIKTREGSRLVRPLLLLAVSVLVFSRFLDHTIIAKDSLIFFAPYKGLILRALREFTIYEWNFYPLNLLFLLLDFGVAHRLYILLHFPLAAGSMYLLLRSRGLREEAGWFGAAVFALSGYLVSQHAPVRMLLGAAWAPLVFYFAGSALDRPRRALAAGAVLAMQVLAGDPETAFVTAAVAATWMIVDGAVRHRPAPAAAVLALMGLSAFVLSAVQTLPAWQLMGLSERSGGLALASALPFSLHPAALAELAWPTPFGLSWPRFFYWGGFTLDIPDLLDPWSASNYLGLPALFLAALALVSGPRRRSLALAGGLIFFLLLALGRYTPVYGWVHAVVPVFDSFRYPAKFMAWVTLVIALAAACGLADALRLVEQSPRTLVRAALVYLAVTVVLAGVSAWAWPLALERLTPFGADSPRTAAALRHLQLGGAQFLAVNLACAAILWLMGRKILSARAGAWLLIAAVGSDLWLANVFIMPSGPADFYRTGSKAALAIREAESGSTEPFRIFREDLTFRDQDRARPGETRPLRHLLWAKDTLLRNLDSFENIQDLVGYGSYELKNGWDLFGKPIKPRELALFNVRYIISEPERKPEELGPADRVYLDPAGDFSLHRLRDPLPRAYWAPAARRARDEAEATAMLNQIDYRREVVITGAGPLPPSSDLATVTPARIVAYHPDRVMVAVDAPAVGWLVLSDRNYPGWTARLDGRPAPIFTANIMVRAVPVPAGRHEIQFVFRQPGLRTGAIISTTAWLGCLIFWLTGWRRRRAPEAAG